MPPPTLNSEEPFYRIQHLNRHCNTLTYESLPENYRTNNPTFKNH